MDSIYTRDLRILLGLFMSHVAKQVRPDVNLENWRGQTSSHEALIAHATLLRDKKRVGFLIKRSRALHTRSHSCKLKHRELRVVHLGRPRYKEIASAAFASKVGQAISPPSDRSIDRSIDFFPAVQLSHVCARTSTSQPIKLVTFEMR